MPYFSVLLPNVPHFESLQQQPHYGIKLLSRAVSQQLDKHLCQLRLHSSDHLGCDCRIWVFKRHKHVLVHSQDRDFHR